MGDDEPTPSGRRPPPGRLPNMECAKNRVKQSHVRPIVAHVSCNSLKPGKLPDGTAEQHTVSCRTRPRTPRSGGGLGRRPSVAGKMLSMTNGTTGSNGADITACPSNWEGEPLSPPRSAPAAAPSA